MAFDDHLFSFRHGSYPGSVFFAGCKQKLIMNILKFLCVFFLILSFFLGWRLIGHQDGLTSYLNLRDRRDVLLGHLSAIEAQNINLSKEIRRLTSDREYLESVIRVEMHYLRPDEVLYIPRNDSFRRSP
ncbi:MAG TPA: septum formation initiator family protein [Desulfonatronum sp.]|nr:septum formation initiator family protein [Desulfonatronum sp.]